MTGSQVVRCLCFVSLLVGLSSGSSAGTIYTFTTIDVPGATAPPGVIFTVTGTEASGINDTGQIVGTFCRFLGRFISGCSPSNEPGNHGFLKDGAIFTTIDVPGATYTEASGINDAGQIVGDFGDATGQHGFLKDGAIFTTIDVPGATYTEASGINDAGQIVGDFGDATGNHGFLKDGAIFTTIDVPGATGTRAFGINGAGQIVGEFIDATGQHGFLKDGAIFTTIGQQFTIATGINDTGQIVGVVTILPQGFLKDGATLTTIDVPGATFHTRALGINGADQIVGEFFDTATDHGFVATPVPEVPEPATWLLFGSGLVGLGWWRRRPPQSEHGKAVSKL